MKKVVLVAVVAGVGLALAYQIPAVSERITGLRATFRNAFDERETALRSALLPADNAVAQARQYRKN